MQAKCSIKKFYCGNFHFTRTLGVYELLLTMVKADAKLASGSHADPTIKTDTTEKKKLQQKGSVEAPVVGI